MDWKEWKPFIFPTGDGEVVCTGDVVEFVGEGTLYVRDDGTVDSYYSEGSAYGPLLTDEAFLERLARFERSIVRVLEPRATERTIERVEGDGWSVSYTWNEAGDPVWPLEWYVRFRPDGLIDNVVVPERHALDPTPPLYDEDALKEAYVHLVRLKKEWLYVASETYEEGPDAYVLAYDVSNELEVMEDGTLHDWTYDFEDERFDPRFEKQAMAWLERLFREEDVRLVGGVNGEEEDELYFKRFVEDVPVQGTMTVVVTTDEGYVVRVAIDEIVYERVVIEDERNVAAGEAEIRAALSEALRVSTHWTHTEEEKIARKPKMDVPALIDAVTGRVYKLRENAWMKGAF